jgi:hypothetical protein
MTWKGHGSSYGLFQGTIPTSAEVKKTGKTWDVLNKKQEQ